MIHKSFITFSILILFAYSCLGQHNTAQYLLQCELNKHQKKLNIKLLRKCIEEGADAKTKGHANWTCLHECALQNDIDFALILIDLHADVNEVNGNHSTPYTIAMSQHHYDLADILRERTNPDNFDLRTIYSDNTPIDFAPPNKRKIIALKEEKVREENENINPAIIRTATLNYVYNSRNGLIKDERIKCILSSDAYNLKSLLEHNYGNLFFNFQVPIKMHGNIDTINVDLLTLACMLDNENIVKTIIDAYKYHSSLPGSIKIYDYSGVDLTTNNNIRQLLDQRNTPIFTRINKDDTVYDADYKLAVDIQNISSRDSIKIYINGVLIDPNRAKIVIDTPKRGVYPLREDVQLNIVGANTFHLVALNGRSSNYYDFIVTFEKDIDIENNLKYETDNNKKEIRKALVIANSTGDLNNTTNDAESMAIVLKNLCFNVKVLIDCDENYVVKTIDTFAKHIADNEIVFFYFAGHGSDFKGQTYIVISPTGPKQIKDNDSSDRYIGYYNTYDVISKMNKVAHLSIFVFDACRDEVYGKQIARRGPKLYSNSSKSYEIPSSCYYQKGEIKGNQGYYEAFSTSKGDYASDGPSELQNSPYTAFLLKNLEIPNLTIEQLFQATEDSVIKHVDSQTPNSSSSIKRKLRNKYILNKWQSDRIRK